MTNCKNFKKYPFCNQCVKTDARCESYTPIYENIEQHIPRID